MSDERDIKAMNEGTQNINNMEVITNKPKENTRVTTYIQDDGVGIHFTSMQDVDEPVAKHFHRLGMTETAISLSKEAAKSLVEQLSYHLMRISLKKN